MTELNIPSPCIGECKINDSTSFCIGCYRTLAEIRGWSDTTNADKLAVVKQLHNRRSDILGTPRRKRNNRRDT